MRRTTIVTGTAVVLGLGLLAPVGPTAAAPAAPTAKRTFDKTPTCDVDGDGFGDLLQVVMPRAEEVGSVPGRLTTIEGSARGVRGSTRSVFEDLRYGESPRWVGADFDRDGHTDVVDNFRIVPGSPNGLDFTRTRPSFAGGYSIVAGNFNGDEWPDLAATFNVDRGPGVENDVQGIQFTYGGPNGFTAEGNVRVDAPAERVYFGSVLAVGDLDGDGIDDVVESGATTASDRPERATWTRGTTNGAGEMREIPDVGIPLVGDLTGDGKDDLVLSRPWQKSGTITVFRGSANGPVKIGTFDQNSPRVPGRNGKPARPGDSGIGGDAFQASSLTDVTGDGRADVIASVPGKDAKGKRDVGRILVLKGSPKGIARKGNVVLKPVTAKLRAHRYLSVTGAAQLDGRGRPELVVTTSTKNAQRYRVLTLAKGEKVRVARTDLLPRTRGVGYTVMNCTH